MEFVKWILFILVLGLIGYLINHFIFKYYVLIENKKGELELKKKRNKKWKR